MKSFDKWNEIKKVIDSSKLNKNFSELEVWFVKLGLNVGSEQDGKGEEFLRPVLVLKKFNKIIFMGIPLTKQIKKPAPFYFQFEFKGQNSTAILSQLRLFDAKRFKFRYGKLSQHDFSELKVKLTRMIE